MPQHTTGACYRTGSCSRSLAGRCSNSQGHHCMHQFRGSAAPRLHAPAWAIGNIAQRYIGTAAKTPAAAAHFQQRKSHVSTGRGGVSSGATFPVLQGCCQSRTQGANVQELAHLTSDRETSLSKKICKSDEEVSGGGGRLGAVAWQHSYTEQQRVANRQKPYLAARRNSQPAVSSFPVTHLCFLTAVWDAVLHRLGLQVSLTLRIGRPTHRRALGPHRKLTLARIRTR